MYKRKKSKLTLVFLSLLLGYFVYTAASQQSTLNFREAEKKAVEVKIESERKLNAELKKQMKDTDTDEYIEKVAREKLGMIKNGEKVFVDINK